MYSVDLRLFKLIYNNSKINFSKLFLKNIYNSYGITRDRLKILEFIVQRGHKIPSEILKLLKTDIIVDKIYPNQRKLILMQPQEFQDNFYFDYYKNIYVKVTKFLKFGYPFEDLI